MTRGSTIHDKSIAGMRWEFGEGEPLLRAAYCTGFFLLGSPLITPCHPDKCAALEVDVLDNRLLIGVGLSCHHFVRSPFEVL